MNYEEAREFQNSQQEVVTVIGALLASLKGFSISLTDDGFDDLAGVRKLQPIVSEFTSTNAASLGGFCEKFHYPTYQREIIRPLGRITNLLGNQTLASKKIGSEQFKEQLDSHVEAISEVMIALAQIIPPAIDVNLKASNPFSAYCFISNILSSVSYSLIVIDPYLDQSIFYRYLYRLDNSIQIKLVSDESKLTGQRLNAFNSVEALFKTEYPNYELKLLQNLHDRYVLTETNAYTLGGSIKDAAKNSDYSITQVSDEKREELLQTYA